MRRLVVASVVLLSACGKAEPPPAPDLRGRWVFDEARADHLYVVTSVPEGDERTRALQRAHRDLGELEVEFDDDTATLRTPWSERTVYYEVVYWAGPLVELVARTDPHGPPVSSSVKLEGERLTWFDAEGEIEFVLKKP